MSKCGRAAQLSFATEVSAELLAHAEHCVSCKHELAWRRTEVALFSQRRSRLEVRSLQQQVRPLPAKRTFWSPVALALAASVLLALGLSLGGGTHEHPSEGGDPMSLELATLAQVPPSFCSTLQPGTGFVCEPVVLASFR